MERRGECGTAAAAAGGGLLAAAALELRYKVRAARGGPR